MSLPESHSAKRCVIIAAFNEGPNLRKLIPGLAEIVPGARVIVVDDNSPDGTPETLKQMAAANPLLSPIIRDGKRGYGGAVMTGFRRALELGATQIATMDADLSHDPNDLPQLFDALERADVAIGSRYAGGVRVINWHPARLLLSLFANRYVKTILRLKVDDATSGFRAYRRNAVEIIARTPISSQGYSFLVEILYCVHRAGCRLCEVPIIYAERREGQSKMSKRVIFEAVIRPWLLRLRPR